MPLALIVGLGNPGDRYIDTRHNLGFQFLDSLASEHDTSWHHKKKYSGWITQLSDTGPWLLKPDTFVNESGDAVRRTLSWLNLECDRMLVIHDELAFPPGVARLKKGGGHGSHNGLKDIISKTGSSDFWRLRLGIGHPGERDQVSRYVLARPSPIDQKLLSYMMQRLLAVFPELITQGPERVQQQIHQIEGTTDGLPE